MASLAELRVLCHQLSSTPSPQLPQITPLLLQNVLRCQVPLSSGASNTGKSDTSEGSVLVHKLKTQISSLLHGKTIEGRFTAVVLIKGIVDVGGWEVLRGAESWVRGLLSILGKSDPDPTKSMCILSLTSVYVRTHQYQSLVREITIPTLPTFISLCLSLTSSKSLGKVLHVSSPLTDTILESFCLLVSHYPTVFRPYNNKIRSAIRRYLAPTNSDHYFVTPATSQSARRLSILLYQTAAKNGSGEEWGKGIRDVVRQIHGTADQVYRAFIEDWESIAGYVSHAVDINQKVHGGSGSEEDLPSWDGIDAGLERLVGLLCLLADHFKYQTITAVIVPLDLIVDLLTRLLSVAPPLNQKEGSEYGAMRLHPAVERNEREGLWTGLPNIHVACMEVYLAVAQRLQQNFIPMAQICLSQVVWSFSQRLDNEHFRTVLYRLVAEVLPLCGSSLNKVLVESLNSMIRACCRELQTSEDVLLVSQDATRKQTPNVSPVNADTFLRGNINQPKSTVVRSSRVLNAATELLPLFLAHLPQQNLQAYLRAEIDRTAILARQKHAMIASILNPFITKNGKILPSVLPHLCREFPDDAAVESILRPRLPVIRSSQAISHDHGSPEELEGSIMEDVVESSANKLEDHNMEGDTPKEDEEPQEKIIVTNSREVDNVWVSNEPKGGVLFDGLKSTMANDQQLAPAPSREIPKEPESYQVSSMNEEDEDDSDKSVHLTMDFSDSEEDGVF